jgi:hypothetical protein
MISGFCNSKEQKSNKGKSGDSLELTASLGGIEYLDTTRTIFIATTLYNPTADTIKFVSMSCSFEDFFVTDNPGFKVRPSVCDKNAPTVEILPPQKKTDRYIMINPVNKESKISDSKIKIGMYFNAVPKNWNFDDIINLYNNREKGKILWSSELDLKKLYRTVY